MRIFLLFFSLCLLGCASQDKKIEKLEEKAQFWDLDSMYELAEIYFHGDGVEIDEIKALSYASLAAERGHQKSKSLIDNEPGADFALGVFELTHPSSENTPQNAFFFFDKSAKQGYLKAITQVAIMYRDGVGVDQSYALAFSYFLSAARKGDSLAMINLGGFWENGYVSDRDYEKAKFWYRKAFDAGNFFSARLIGSLYLDLEDSENALSWFRKGAESGDSFSQLWMGVHYLDGDYIPQNYIEGYKWISLAAVNAKESDIKEKALDLMRKAEKQSLSNDQLAKAQESAASWQRKFDRKN